MRILVITPYYYPHNNPRSNRWSQIVQNWQIDHEVEVLTSQDFKNIDKNENHILRHGYSTPDKRYSRNITEGRSFPGRNLLKSIFKSFMWPDESASWVRSVKRLCQQKVQLFHPDVIVTVSWPFSSHLLGLHLKSKFDFLWLADIGDPFDFQNTLPRNNETLFKSLNTSTETQVMRMTDLVVVTNEHLRMSYKDKFNIDHVHCIGPMTISDHTENQSHSINSDKIDLGYFGSLYAGVREPDMLIRLANAIASIKDERRYQLHIYGSIKPEIQKHIHGKLITPDIVEFHPKVERRKAIELMKKMDALISIGNDNIYQTPSKIVDYAICEKPIIHLCQVEHSDPNVILLNGHGAVGVIKDTHSWEEFQQITLETLNRIPNREFARDMASRYHPTTIARQYLNLISRIVGH